nr:hypothetical protein [Mucilaginibacter sp.]
MNPTKPTTMLNGPGVVLASAKPSAICILDNQANFPTANCAT